MDSPAADEPLFGRTGNQGDGFYDASAEYDNQINQHASSGAEGADAAGQDPEERAKQEEEWKAELIKLEQEITTLKSVLSVKVAEANRLKHNLGITPIKEFQQDVKQGLRNIKESDTYQKTGTALKTFGSWSSKKMSDARNSTLFKSVEEKVGGAYSNVKHSSSIGNFKTKMTRVTGSKSENSFEEALTNSSANQEPSPDLTGSSEKVPL